MTYGPRKVRLACKFRFVNKSRDFEVVSTRYALVAAVKVKWQVQDIVAWLWEFDACALANRWNDEHKIKKLLAYLSGRATSHFYVISDDQRTTYAKATKRLKEILCPLVERKKFLLPIRCLHAAPWRRPRSLQIGT